jgi:hypothetical protein
VVQKATAKHIFIVTRFVQSVLGCTKDVDEQHDLGIRERSHTHTYAFVTMTPFSIRTMGCISVRLVPIGIDALDTGTCGGATVLSPV